MDFTVELESSETPIRASAIPKTEIAAEAIVEKAERGRVYTIDVPSKNVFYSGSDGISLRNFRFEEYMDIGISQQAKSFRSLAEAVSNTILLRDGMTMTYGDFRFVMHTHRLNMSAFQRPYTIPQWLCSSEKHLRAIEAGQLVGELQGFSLDEIKLAQEPEVKAVLTDESLINKNLQISKIHLQQYHPLQKELEALFVEAMEISKGQITDPSRGEIAPGLFLYPPIVRLMIELEEEREAILNAAALIETEDDANIDRLMEAERKLAALNQRNEYALHLSDRHGKTLAEKRAALSKWFDAYEGDEEHYQIMLRIKRFEELSKHGVNETITATCGVCGEEQKVPLRFSPTDFFPSVDKRTDIEG